MPDPAPIGGDAKIRINGIPFALVSYNWEETADLPARNTTESGRKKRVKSGMTQFRFDGQAQRDEDVSPHLDAGGDLGLYAGAEVHLEFAPYGFIGGHSFYDVPSFILESNGGGGQVEGSQIQTYTVRGQSNGDYFLIDQ